MALRWTDSTDKHGISRGEAVHAVVHAIYGAAAERIHGGRIVLYFGPRTLGRGELEVLVRQYGNGREGAVFYVVDLGPTFRRYREQNPQ